MMDIKVYEYYINKTKGKNFKKIRLDLIKEKENICEKCNQRFNNIWLEADHKIPVVLCGKIFNKTNLQILCRDCHRIKTHQDLTILSVIRKLGLIQTYRFYVLSFIKIDELHKIYFKFKKLHDQATYVHNMYSYEDSIFTIKYKENRM
jgi:hypothetical protein